MICGLLLFSSPRYGKGNQEKIDKGDRQFQTRIRCATFKFENGDRIVNKKAFQDLSVIRAQLKCLLT